MTRKILAGVWLFDLGMMVKYLIEGKMVMAFMAFITLVLLITLTVTYDKLGDGTS